MRPRWAVPAAACALGLALAAPVVAAQPATIPSQWPTYTFLGPPSISSTLPDGAIAAYQNGWGVEFMDIPRAVVLGADGHSLRSLELAKDRAGHVTQGDPASFALSPDGTFVLVGSAVPSPTLERLDLVTGERTSIPLGRAVASTVLAVPDADTALIVTGETMGDYSSAGDGPLMVIDLAGGRVVREFEGFRTNSAALSPDGNVLAVVEGRRLVYRDARTGAELGMLAKRAVEDGMLAPALFVDGDAWSPDGSRLVVHLDYELRITSPEDRTASEVVAVEGDFAEFVGWRSDTEIVVQETTFDPVDNAAEIVAIDLRTGAREVVSTYDPGFTGAAVGRLDLARDLLPDAVVGPPRAPAPSPVLIGAGVVGAGVVAILVVRGVRRRRTRHAVAVAALE